MWYQLASSSFSSLSLLSFIFLPSNSPRIGNQIAFFFHTHIPTESFFSSFHHLLSLSSPNLPIPVQSHSFYPFFSHLILFSHFFLSLCIFLFYFSLFPLSFFLPFLPFLYQRKKETRGRRAKYYYW